MAHRNQLRYAGLGLTEEQLYRVPGCLDKEIPVGCQRGLLAGCFARCDALLTGRMGAEAGCLAPACRVPLVLSGHALDRRCSSMFEANERNPAAATFPAPYPSW